MENFRSLFLLDTSAEIFFSKTDATPTFYGKKTFKFSMILEEGKLKMLLMVSTDHSAFHSEAILRYMWKKGISRIALSGSGTISFGEKMDTADLLKGSSRYEDPSEADLVNFLLKLNDSMVINLAGIHSPSKENKAFFHRTYSIGEIEQILEKVF